MTDAAYFVAAPLQEGPDDFPLPNNGWGGREFDALANFTLRIAYPPEDIPFLTVHLAV